MRLSRWQMFFHRHPKVCDPSHHVQYQLRLADAPTGTENVDTRMKWFLTPVTAPDGRYKYYWPSHRDRPVTTGQIVVAFWVKGCMARGKRWDNSPPAPCSLLSVDSS